MKRRLISSIVVLVLVISGWIISSPVWGDEIYAMNPPCRILDTRQTGGGGTISQGRTRNFLVRGTPGGSQGGLSGCGIPTDATGVVLNIGVIGPSAAGWATVWTYGETEPYVTVVSTTAGGGFALTGGTMVWLSSGTPTYDLALHYYAMSGNAVVDVVGYLEAGK